MHGTLVNKCSATSQGFKHKRMPTRIGKHFISIVTGNEADDFHVNIREDSPRKRVIGLYTRA